MLDGTRQQVLCYHTVMASRKPKGIADDIVGGIRNIVSPWLGTPPLEQPAVTQFKQVTRVAAEGLDQAFAGGMIKAGTQGNKALVKQAAVNAAALGVGYVAGKVVQTAAGAVTNKLINVRNQNTSYLFHGSGKENLPIIKPQPPYLKNLGLKDRTYLTSDVETAESVAQISASAAQQYVGTPKDLRGTLYVVANRTKNIKPLIGGPYESESATGNVNTFITNKNSRIVSKIKTLKYPETVENLQSLAQKAIEADRQRKLFGFKQPKRR